MPRYLLGPVAQSFNEDVFAPNNDVRFFGPPGEQSLSLAPDGSWDDLLKQLPDDRRPDFLVLWLPYTSISPKLWQAPVPIIGLAPDGNPMSHLYRRILPRCDLAFGSVSSVERWRCAGLKHVQPLNLCGLGPAHAAALAQTSEAAAQGKRDLDVLFVGNLHPGVHRERNTWLGRLAQLSSRFQIAIRSGVFRDEYRSLLKRAKIVFNYSAPGECNRRVFEAIAGGALLLQERDNAEVAALLKPGMEYAPYDESNLEAVIEHFLSHDDERRAMVRAARARLAECTFSAYWSQALEAIERDWSALQERMQARLRLRFQADLPAALWAAASGAASEELPEALSRATDRALGLLAVGLLTQDPEQAATRFDQTLDLDPTHMVAGLNRVEVLARLGKKDEAIVQARQALFHLERRHDLPADVLEAPHWPIGFDLFRVEWERAAWENPGDEKGEQAAKRCLLRSRLHSLLADLTGDLGHYAAAVLARPDLATLQAALGCALARAKRFPEALPHLRAAVETDPFDGNAARAFFQVLGDAGDFAGRAAFAQRRQAIHRAAPEIVPSEEWFQKPPLSGQERASIVVPACNQAELTRLCLESVLRCTHGDYELILIDNGSTDGVPEIFEEMRSRQGPARVEVIRNAENLGFSKGVNQGIAAAQGEYIVLLNNDTVLTPGWLEGLIRWSLHDWPNVGLVGPLTNQAPAPQLHAPGYQDLDGLEPFARHMRRGNTGQALETPRLTGFCLLIRKAALAAIGGTLDERFVVGFFGDDDLCLRARQAGFKLFVAKDVYIHHFGSQTFAKLQLDTETLLREGFHLFRDKWGNEAAAPYRMSEPPADPINRIAPPQRDAGTSAAPPASPPAAGPQLNGVSIATPSLNGLTRPHSVAVTPTKPSGDIPCSLCIITKNEAKNLADCIGPLRELFKDIVVVDTGSTDKTRELARALGARVFEFPWVDSFAAARNETLRHALGRWIFWMDADDRIDPENVAKLKHLLDNLPDANVAYVMKCLCVARAPGETATVVDHVRLFRNDSRIRWKYRVHEQILGGVKSAGGRSEWSDVVIRHIGYTDPALRGRKLERDLRLLRLEVQEQPDDPFTLFNLGSHYHEVNKPAEALPHLRRSLDKSHPQDSIVRKLYATIAQCERALDRLPAAVTACAEGRQHYPDDAELLFLEGTLLHAQGERSAAIERFQRLLESSEGQHFASVDTGLRGYKARQNLAAIYMEQQRYSEAEAQLRTVLIEEPAYLLANRVLGEVLVRKQDWSGVESHAESLGKLGMQGEIESAALLGRAKIERREFGAARFGLKLACERYPQSLPLWRLLAQAATSEAIHPRESEGALRRILELDPADELAKRALLALKVRRAG